MEISINSDAAMRDLGGSVGRALLGVDGPVTIELVGDVGAGKTTFVKGLAAGLGVDGDVSSPSFTISRVYDIPDISEVHGRRLHHYDFYRLSDAGILNDELAEVTADPLAFIVIEWADIVTGVLPDDHIRLSIRATGETTRSVIAYGLPPAVTAGLAKRAA